MKVAVPMSMEMVAFLDTHSMELSEMMGSKTSRADLVRESVARIAWDHFGIDIEWLHSATGTTNPPAKALAAKPRCGINAPVRPPLLPRRARDRASGPAPGPAQGAPAQ